MKKETKEYLNLALPSGLECIIGVFITMTDTFAISKLGTNVIAAVGAMGSVIDLICLLLQSVNISNNAIVARLRGKNELKNMKMSTGTAIYVSIICSLICIFITLCISKYLPGLFKIDSIGLTYLYVRLFGIIPNTILTILSGHQRTIGNSKNMLSVRIITLILNAILDFVFVYLGYGVWGVALATVLVEIIVMIILIVLSKESVIYKFDKSISKELINLVKYNIYERIFKRGSNFLLNVILSRLGSIEYAVHIIVMQFIDIINNFFHGIGIGTQTALGVAIGNRNIERLKTTSYTVKRVNFVLTFIINIILVASLFLLLPKYLEEPRALQLAYKLIIFVIINSVLSCFYQYYTSILRAMKEFKYIAKISFWIYVIVKLMLAYILCKYFGIYGAWISFIVSNFIIDILFKKKSALII